MGTRVVAQQSHILRALPRARRLVFDWPRGDWAMATRLPLGAWSRPADGISICMAYRSTIRYRRRLRWLLYTRARRELRCLGICESSRLTRGFRYHLIDVNAIRHLTSCTEQGSNKIRMNVLLKLPWNNNRCFIDTQTFKVAVHDPLSYLSHPESPVSSRHRDHLSSSWRAAAGNAYAAPLPSCVP